MRRFAGRSFAHRECRVRAVLPGISRSRRHPAVIRRFPRWPAAWRLPYRGIDRRGRDGCGLPRAGHAAGTRGRRQGPAGRMGRRCPASTPVRTRGARGRGAQSSQHLHHLRRRPRSGLDFLVTELVDGDSLATRLAKGPLPLDQAIGHAIEIADALDRAHRQGIIHRDLKPGNVMLARTGAGTSNGAQAKLLDFGLARIIPSGADAGLAATDTTPKTQAGALLGTLQVHMSPEQIEGLPADARTDIFAFGALLHEMLTGRRAFEGTSTAGMMAAILRSDPPPVHPREVGRIVRRCLEKNPLRRYQSARDLLNDLEECKGNLAAGRLEATTASPLHAGRRVEEKPRDVDRLGTRRSDYRRRWLPRGASSRPPTARQCPFPAAASAGRPRPAERLGRIARRPMGRVQRRGRRTEHDRLVLALHPRTSRYTDLVRGGDAVVLLA